MRQKSPPKSKDFDVGRGGRGMIVRMSISKKTRFEIFKRDGFICQYCGNHPPAVILHVDHITPVARGGVNDQDNLITACDACNLGKGARPLNVAPQGLAEKAAEIAEREAQLLGYQEILQAQRERVEREVWQVVAVMTDGDSFRKDYLQSIRIFIEKLGVHEVIDAMELAVARKPYSAESTKFKYFCGVCWNKINRAKEGGHG